MANEKPDHSEKKELGTERLILFSDAIVAIAITLLALELKLETPPGHHLTFYDLLQPWEKYLAFILSFVNIAGFWRTHHLVFIYIRKMDEKMMLLNLTWLFFIVILPFTTSLISLHLGDPPVMVVYCANIFILSVLQNTLWDYAAWPGKGFVDRAKMGEEILSRMRIMFNLEMVNALVAVIVSFFAPVLAFILLFFKIPLIIFVTFYIAAQRRKRTGKRQSQRPAALI